MRRTTTAKRVCGGVFGGALLAGAAAMIAAACTHDDTTVFVHHVIAPQLVAAGQQCTYTSDPTQPIIENGVLDLGFLNVYTAVFLVGNQLVPQGNPSAPATETSYVNLQGGVVRITDTKGTQIETYTQLLGVTIPPSVGTTPGYAPVGLEIVDENVTKMYAAMVDTGSVVRVITYTRFFGKTLGGQSVESNEFEYPVDICYGCLVSFPLGVSSPSPAFPQPNCVNAGSASSNSSSVPCTPGQDFTTPCTACTDLTVCRDYALDGGTD